ncbi:hypothetical protein [Bradyrhizobium sp. RDT46]|uniref:hypothetical protein n=1 Tax=Bradyrhizobium sp. RDT46 TaxID=3341829 RepID=UPI0035C67021
MTPRTDRKPRCEANPRGETKPRSEVEPRRDKERAPDRPVIGESGESADGGRDLARGEGGAIDLPARPGDLSKDD